MYSAVLMLALTAGAETPDFGRRGCSGSTGCSSSVVAAPSCCGTSRGHGGLFSGRGCSGGGLFSGRGHGCSGMSGCSSRGGLFHRNRSSCSCGPVVYTCAASTGCAAPTMAPKTMPKSEAVPVTPKKTAVEVPATDIASQPVAVDNVVTARRVGIFGLRRN